MIMDYGLWWIIMEYGLSWIIVDEWGLSWVMDYMDYCGLLCTIVAQCGLSWIIVDSKKMHHHGIAWIRRYAPQASDDP